LGVLYVVDSVTRQWVDQARKAGQTPGSGAPDGTFAAGVNRVTELLPVLLTDIINTAPEDQKVRYRNGERFPENPRLPVFYIFGQSRHGILLSFTCCTVLSPYDLDSTYVL
jgi:hypothetical protein